MNLSIIVLNDKKKQGCGILKKLVFLDPLQNHNPLHHTLHVRHHPPPKKKKKKPQPPVRFDHTPVRMW